MHVQFTDNIKITCKKHEMMAKFGFFFTCDKIGYEMFRNLDCVKFSEVKWLCTCNIYVEWVTYVKLLHTFL